MYWGTYRANLYFGMKTRSPKSPVVGLMWFEEIPGGKNRSKPNIRHWCKPNDGLRYGWKKHDGKSFGIQEIVDDKFSLTTSFLKHSKSKGFSLKEIDFAKAGISNLLGEISYFYGSSRVKSKYSTKPLDYWPAALYTSIPSRSNFPRGFLWNVGFDNLLISLWDPKITEDIIGHWLDLLNKEGWIPREQILGEEAKARCPDKFIVQNNKNANPPTLFLTVQYLMRRGIVDKTFLEKIFPRLKVMFDWYNTSQAGLLPSTYYWRGRHYNVIHQINPLTPSSGFDDYPRASHPSSKELHLDLRCWMALASRAMSDIGKKIKKEWQIYEDTHQLLVDNDLLDKYHWSSLKSMYSDIGLHVPLKYRGHKPKLLYINSFGYASLFPIMLKIIDPESGRLTQMLSDMKKHELLWTDYGLRSLAKNSSFYQLPNTVTDPPYWRGSIWINMNYLTLSGLYYYRTTPGKNQKLATDVYNELRRNIISNVYKEYSKRGFLFEQYDDKTGAGKGAHPFSGCSALIVAIMAEEY
ncbi:uncharacterized protein LOC143084264 [Mytilus galloprovincialis]|uniref:uncharacterized protein LOC143084264 n=1 Tax=Mytilus galloprovincialis TaxID=29158 RepID=UPI003F7C0AE4